MDQSENLPIELTVSPYVAMVLVGQVRHLGDPGATDPMDRPWKTGMFKNPVDGETWLSPTGLTHDEVAETKFHGGPEKAVFAYSLSHYEYWNTRPGLHAMQPGAMGENMAMENADELSVCLGDIYQFQNAILQVSQPRQPCWKPARRFRSKDLALQIQQSGRTGWYFRVLQEGTVRAGVSLQLIERPTPRWTIALCNQVMHHKPHDLQLTAELAAHPHLAASWKETLENRLAGAASSTEKRLFGATETH